MQVDKIIVDFGLITNSGYSQTWPDQRWIQETEVWFWIGVEVSDHPSTPADSVHNVSVTASIADIILTKDIPLTIKRSATKDERKLSIIGNIDFLLKGLGTKVFLLMGTKEVLLMGTIGFLHRGTKSIGFLLMGNLCFLLIGTICFLLMGTKKLII